MPKYGVTYEVYLEIEAEDEDEAIDKAVEEWNNTPDGLWDVREIGC